MGVDNGGEMTMGGRGQWGVTMGEVTMGGKVTMGGGDNGGVTMGW